MMSVSSNSDISFTLTGWPIYAVYACLASGSHIVDTKEPSHGSICLCRLSAFDDFDKTVEGLEGSRRDWLFCCNSSIKSHAAC